MNRPTWFERHVIMRAHYAHVTGIAGLAFVVCYALFLAGAWLTGGADAVARIRAWGLL